MNNQIPTDLFWIRTVRYELDLYSEAMSLFCRIILYHIDSFGESFSTALKNDLVKPALFTLTVCIHNTNPHASKEDVATSVRTALYNYIEDYDTIEQELLKHIPDVSAQEVFRYSIINANPDFEDIPPLESIEYIRHELARISSQALKHQYVDCSGS